MCGRFTLSVRQLAEVAAEVEAFLDPMDASTHRPRFNIAPTSRHWLMRLDGARRELVPAHWGLLNSWATVRSAGAKQCNARAETVSVKPAFRAAFRSRRCVVPLDGFYEWHGKKTARTPVWFHAPDRSILWLAGLYETWTEPVTGASFPTFTLITTQANAVVAPIHDRMPVVLARRDVAGWLDAAPGTLGRAQALLVPAPATALTFFSVSRRVNSVHEDDPSLIEAAPEVPAAQLGLRFDG